LISAFVSFGEHDRRSLDLHANWAPMRFSRPMPRATSCTLARTFSETSADFVDEGDGRKERVCGVFDHLGGAAFRKNQRRLVQ